VLVQFATAKIGAMMVNINPAYRTYELEYALRQAEVQTLIIQDRFKTSDYVSMFYEACPEAARAEPGQIASEYFPFLRTVVFLGDTPQPGMYTWNEFLQQGREIGEDELREREELLDFDDPINIQYSMN
jgi:fatty-acyl-CoA synthase